ncbi:MAG: sugar ABC transporter ATP-binding protein [Vallitaleaceae bacterium]|nr:sugar ABC transporter ATP-binding protein [Vallitaleaceae bacterium]
MTSKLEFKKITKIFPGVKALDDVSFEAHGGNVTALVGENGAGKSTLLKVLNGDFQPDGGEYIVDGVVQQFKSPKEAIDFGIGVIYQERQVVPYLSVAENIYMDEIPINKGGFINYSKLNAMSQEIITEFNLPIKPTDKIKDLSVAFQQMVEIMKVYRRNPKIIAFDEPTASLSQSEIISLFEIIKKLKDRGIIVLYVSHRMKEIFQITDQIIILKDGRYVDTVDTKNTTEKEIVKKMVGRSLGDVFGELVRNTVQGNTILSVKNLTNHFIKDVSFELKTGEVLGFAGLVGAGRTETMRAIYGADKIESGEVILEGKVIAIKSPKQAISVGIALCPEDRKDEGIIGARSIKENISISILKQLEKFFLIDNKADIKLAKESVVQLNIRTPNIYKKIIELSGGNQQKVLLARSLSTKPKILILDEPTKGIDVGAKSEIYKIIQALAREGIGVIVISSELPEIMGLCDRIIVMCEGKVTGEIMRAEATEEGILTMAMIGMM